MRELVNAKITHVSLVDKAANGKTFAIVKSDCQPQFQTSSLILKQDEEKRIVTAVVYEPDVLDAHGDFMTSDSIEKAAHMFLKDSRNVDLQHNFKSGFGEVVESYVAKSEHAIGEQTVTEGTWVMTIHVTDDATWEGIKKGDITGLSMAGLAETIEKQEDKKSVAKSEEEEAKGFFNLVKNFFTKGQVADKYTSNKQTRDFWAIQDAFESSIRSYNWATDKFEFESDETKVREALTDYVTIVQDILMSDNIMKSIGQPKEEVSKAGKKISSANMQKIKDAHTALNELMSIDTDNESEEVEVNKEQLEALTKSIETLANKVSEIEKQAESTPEEVKKEEEVADAVAQLNDTISKLNDRIDTLEKARGISKANTENADTIEKSDNRPSYMKLLG